MRTRSSEGLVCFFCDSTEGDIHKALTFQLERMVKQCATILEDNKLLGKPNAGDIIVKDVIYHSHLVLYRRSKQKSFVLDDNENDFKKQIHDQVPLELALYMQQTANEDNMYIFKTVDLANLYKTRVRVLGGHTHNRVHTTKLKQRRLFAY